jgi:uncharacterized protein (UPF0333 family)
MSRYDRRQERKRFLIVAAVIVVFAGLMYVWGHSFNAGISSMGQATSQSGQDLD